MSECVLEKKIERGREGEREGGREGGKERALACMYEGRESVCLGDRGLVGDRDHRPKRLCLCVACSLTRPDLNKHRTENT